MPAQAHPIARRPPPQPLAPAPAARCCRPGAPWPASASSCSAPPRHTAAAQPQRPACPGQPPCFFRSAASPAAAAPSAPATGGLAGIAAEGRRGGGPGWAQIANVCGPCRAMQRHAPAPHNSCGGQSLCRGWAALHTPGQQLGCVQQRSAHPSTARALAAAATPSHRNGEQHGVDRGPPIDAGGAGRRWWAGDPGPHLQQGGWPVLGH